MGLKPYDNLVLAHANLIHYWPLDGDLNDVKGTNHLTGTNGWTIGPIGNKAALFDGISQQLQSSANIDLTGTNKVTLEMMIQWIVYNITNSSNIAEFSPSISVNPGFLLLNIGSIANDPLVTSCRTNVGTNNGLHNYPANGVVVRYWKHIIADFDVSRISDESSLCMNGIQRVRDSQTASSNNTANFPNDKLYLASNAGTSAYANIAISNVALYDTTLTAAEKMQHAQLAMPRKRHRTW